MAKLKAKLLADNTKIAEILSIDPLTLSYSKGVYTAPGVKKSALKSAYDQAKLAQPNLMREQLKTRAATEINATMWEILLRKNKYTSEQLKRYDIKTTQAKEFLADPTSSAPIIRAKAKRKGATLESIANKIIAKADTFNTIISNSEICREYLEDLIDNTPDKDLNKLNISKLIGNKMKKCLRAVSSQA